MWTLVVLGFTAHDAVPITSRSMQTFVPRWWYTNLLSSLSVILGYWRRRLRQFLSTIRSMSYGFVRSRNLFESGKSRRWYLCYSASSKETCGIPADEDVGDVFITQNVGESCCCCVQMTEVALRRHCSGCWGGREERRRREVIWYL